MYIKTTVRLTDADIELWKSKPLIKTEDHNNGYIKFTKFIRFSEIGRTDYPSQKLKSNFMITMDMMRNIDVREKEWMLQKRDTEIDKEIEKYRNNEVEIDIYIPDKE